MERDLDRYLAEQGYRDGILISPSQTVDAINSIIKGRDAALLFSGWTWVDESRLYGNAIRVSWTARYRNYLIAGGPPETKRLKPGSMPGHVAYSYNPFAAAHNDGMVVVHTLTGTFCTGAYDRLTFDHPDLHGIRPEPAELILFERSSRRR